MALRKRSNEYDLRFANHVVTVYTFNGEDLDGNGKWIRTLVTNCSLVKKQGVHTLLTRTMEVPNDRAVLYFFMDTANATNIWVPEHEFFTNGDIQGYFTIRSDGKDRVIEGEYQGDIPPGDSHPNVFKVNLVVDHTRMGSYDMQHLRMVLG